MQPITKPQPANTMRERQNTINSHAISNIIMSTRATAKVCGSDMSMSIRVAKTE